MRTPVAEAHLALEHDVDVDEDIAAVLERAAHVDARRIGERHARQHQLLRHLRATRAFDLRQLRLVVDPEHLGGLVEPRAGSR